MGDRNSGAQIATAINGRVRASVTKKGHPGGWPAAFDGARHRAGSPGSPAVGLTLVVVVEGLQSRRVLRLAVGHDHTVHLAVVTVVAGHGVRVGELGADYDRAARVAGPWLLSIAGITLIYKLTDLALAQNAGLFIAAVVYTYAFSLVIALLGVGALSAGMGTLGLLLTGPFPVDHPGLYHVSAVGLFVTVNLI